MNVSAINFTGSVLNSRNKFSFGEVAENHASSQTVEDKLSIQNTEHKQKGASKVGVGIASFVIPGLGQGINGQWGKGAAFFLGAAATGIPLAFAYNALFLREKTTAAVFFTISMLGNLGVRIWSVIDAVKNADKK